LFLTWPTSQVPGTRQRVVVRSRLAAAVVWNTVQIACEVQRVGKIGPWRDCAGRSGRWRIGPSFGRCVAEHFNTGIRQSTSSICRSLRRFCGWGEDLQPNPSNASRRRQSCALFGYDSCACSTALLKLMPDDARRPARLQGRDAAEDARTTHPCIRRWLGMLAEGPWEYSTMGKMGFNAYPDTTGHFRWWLAAQKHRT
jgi:hypothetical protein